MNRSVLPLDEDQKLQLCLERDRLLCDPEFERSPTMSKLLRFLVEHRLSQDSQPLKAYTIAVDALGRDESFDTETDSYPRVQISRLRKLLERFYQREGGENRLSIPHNNYEIAIVSNTGEDVTLAQLSAGNMIGVGAPSDQADPVPLSLMQTSEEGGTRRWSRLKVGIVTGFGAILFSIAAGYFLFIWTGQSEIAYPAIIVADTSGAGNEETRIEAEATKAYFIRSLGKFDQLGVWSRENSENHSRLYTLESRVLDDAGEAIQFQLIDNETDELIWSDQLTLADGELLEPKLASIVINIAGPYGIIGQAEITKHRDDFTPGYPCILQFHQLVRFRDMAIVDSVRNCMLKSAARFPNDAYMLSMLAVARSAPKPSGSGITVGPSAMDVARRAVQLDNQSSSASFAVAQAAFFDGDCATGVAWGERAVELNPLNSRIAGYLGLYMLACSLPEGEEYTALALEIDPNTDLAIAAALAFQKLQRGDALGAQQLSQKYMAGALRVEPGLDVTYILSTAALGDKVEARRAWKDLASRYGHSEYTPVREVLSSWIANPGLIDEVVLAFDEVELY